jgi:hypothetical protein
MSKSTMRSRHSSPGSDLLRDLVDVTAMLRSLRGARRQRLVAAAISEDRGARLLLEATTLQNGVTAWSRALWARALAQGVKPGVRNQRSATPQRRRPRLVHAFHELNSRMAPLTEEELHSLPSLNHRVAGALTVALDLSHELAWLVEVDLLVRHRAVFKMPRW